MELPREFDHYDPALAADPYPVLREMRERCPVGRSERHGGFWAITRYHDVYDVAHDPTTFSSALGHITIPTPDTPMAETLRAIPIEVDPPAHHTYRSLVNPFFSPARIKDMEPWVRAISHQLIDGFADRGQADLAEEYSFPLPMFVICRILGIPSERWSEFRQWISKLLLIGESPAEAMEGAAVLAGFVGGVLEERRQKPGDDLVSFLTTAEVDGERMTDMDLLGFCILLFGAGAETTTNAIGNSLAYLAEHHELRDRLAADPTLIPAAVEEFLRYDTPVFGLARTVACDTELAGQTMREGERVLLLWGSANHDDTEFERSEEVEIDRPVNRHLAFGAGVHRCLGSHLARTEIRIALEDVLARMPDFDLVPGRGVERCVGVTRGVRSLPVQFSPA